MIQMPTARQFHADAAWPDDLKVLYEEAAKSYSAGAFTSSSLMCRKILMSCVCHEQAQNGKEVKERETFKYYVDYLTNEVLTFQRAKAAIDKIRDIGNDATHKVQSVSQPDAERSLKIIGYLLTTLYSLPQA
jgi:hypothetical protein